MRRLLGSLAVMALLRLAMMAVPAFAATDTDGCIGHEASLFNRIRKAHGLSGVGGEIISGAAREGRISGELASSDCTQG